MSVRTFLLGKPGPSNHKGRPPAHCGQAIVEFALVFPLLCYFLFGVVDFGRGVAAYIALAQSAREGARAGIYTSATDGDIKNSVRAQAGILGNLPDSAISISPSYPRASGDNLSVVISYNFDPVTPLISAMWGGGSLHLVGESTMRVQ